MPPELVWRPECPIVQRSSSVSGKPLTILCLSVPSRTGWLTTTGNSWIARCPPRSMLANCMFFLLANSSWWTFSWCRTIRFCHPLQSGDYKLHLEAGERTVAKTISVCVVGGQFCFVFSYTKVTFVEFKKNLFPKINIGFHKNVAKLFCCPLSPPVLDPPLFNFSFNEVDNTIICETATLVPATYTWMSCPSSNDRYARQCTEV